jgi:predicted nucleotidyltransferase
MGIIRGSGAMFDINQFRGQMHSYFAGQPAVVLAYLFGSHARGKPHAHSDIDIAVLHRPELDKDASFDLRLDLIGDLMGLLHTNDVDVIILNRAPLTLAYRVLRDGVNLFARDEEVRILYQATTISHYLDFKPFVDYQDRMILERARKGQLRNGRYADHDPLTRYRQMRERLGIVQNDGA